MLKLLVEVPKGFNKKDHIKIKQYLTSRDAGREGSKERIILGFSKNFPAYFNYSEQGISVDFSISDKIDHILIEIPRSSQFTEIMADKDIEEFFIRYIYSDLDKKMKNILEGFKETILRKKKVKEDLFKNFSYEKTSILYTYSFGEIVDGVYNLSHSDLGIDIVTTIWRSMGYSYGTIFFAIDESDIEKRLIKENIVYNYFHSKTRGHGH